MFKTIERIVIVGGGTAGWMAAAMLAKRYKEQPLHIELIESPDIPTVGVGEATVPGITRLHQYLEIGEVEFIKATGATFKLGIEFDGWHSPGKRFFHPFSEYGTDIGGKPFYPCWLTLQNFGYRSDLGDYSLAVKLAKENRFAQPDNDASSSLALYNYAYHFDAGLYAKFLKSYAMERGVTHRLANVESVELNPSDQSINRLMLVGGESIDGDFYVDCSGFKSLLLGDALGVPFVSWADMLPCDRAVVVQTENTMGLPPYTRSMARSAGWQWRIPLENRCGNGYVYCSQYLQDEEAIHELMSTLEERCLTEPRILEFEAGMRREFWYKNCIAVGLASGFIEPLESTSISLIQTGIEKLIQFMPDLCLVPERVIEANRLNRLEYERIRDFIVLHYQLSEREDSEFWRSFWGRPVSSELQQKLDAFDEDGSIVLKEQESFREASWQAMFNGFGRLPRSCPLSALAFDPVKLDHVMTKMRNVIVQASQYAPEHRDFLSQLYTMSARKA